MHDIDVRGLDLNLLVSLRALLEAGSVTGAARRLGVGQPAASHALSRLRALFDDPLLVRAGRHMVLTPRAEELRQPLAQWLADGTRLVQPRAAFRPEATTRRFALICPDLVAPVIPRIVARLAADAPGARLEVVGRSHDDTRALEVGDADLLLAPTPEVGPGLVRRGLGEVHFGVVARHDHPALSSRGILPRKAWLAHPHVLVRTGHGGRMFVGPALAAAGFERHIGVVVPTFLAALVTVAETDFFLTIPRELVTPMAHRLGLRVLKPPLPLPSVAIAAVWHERLHVDPAHRFFRDLACEEVLRLHAPAQRRRIQDTYDFGARR